MICLLHWVFPVICAKNIQKHPDAVIDLFVKTKNFNQRKIPIINNAFIAVKKDIDF
jgi:hypothetical protein